MPKKLFGDEREMAIVRHTAYMKQWHRDNRARVQEHKKKYRDRQRIMALAALGNKCAHCGESDPVVLAIDHINDDGAHERNHHNGKRKNGYCAMYIKIINGTDDGRYQLLCYNCNWRKEVRRRETEYAERQRSVGKKPIEE